MESLGGAVVEQAARVARPTHVPPDRVVDFDIYAPPGATGDYHRAWKALQAAHVPDLIWTPRNGGHWIATRNRVIGEVMADYTHFANTTQVVPKAAGGGYTLLPTTLDPPAHRPYRTLLNSSLSPRVVRQLEEPIRGISRELIASVQAAGRCDFIKAYAELFPVRVFFSMVDLPMTDAPMLKQWSDEMLRPPKGVDWGTDGTGFARGIRLFSEYLEPHVDARMGGSGDDMLTRLVNGEVEGRPLTRDEALQLTSQVLIAGLDTVVNFLGFAMLHLARHAEQRRELVADPSLIPDAVEELLRRYPIVVIPREVVVDIEFHGVQLKQGELVATPTPLGGIDDHDNDRPMEVDFHRSGGEHVTFGNGPHRCPGANLARTEVRITLEEWLAHIPEFEIEPGSTIRFTPGSVAVVDTLPLVWATG
jgi:cytochrome P450